jgi:hypothetical protein
VRACVAFHRQYGLPKWIEVYQAAHLLVMPPTAERFGITFKEAMTSGAAVHHRWTRDALANGQLGTAQSLIGLLHD